jgi:hypothetical protein
MHQVSKILFCHETLHVSGIFCSHHQELSAVHVAVCFMQGLWPLPGLEPEAPRQRPHYLHETYELPRVQLITPDDGHRRCPKHVVS